MKALSFLSPPTPCEYVPGQVRSLRYEVVPGLTPGAYRDRIDDGWRRFGYVLFRPECPSCQRCQSLRVPVSTFRPNQSQRRAWKSNSKDVTVRLGSPSLTPAKVALYQRFHAYKEAAIGWPHNDGEGLDLFTQNQFATEEWSYFVGERLIGVGWVDVLDDALSAIYFFHDPEERQRSLGTFNILSIISAAQDRSLAYVHLGYYVEGCRSLEYKARFRPNELLTRSGDWQPLAASTPGWPACAARSHRDP